MTLSRMHAFILISVSHCSAMAKPLIEHIYIIQLYQQNARSPVSSGVASLSLMPGHHLFPMQLL